MSCRTAARTRIVAVALCVLATLGSAPLHAAAQQRTKTPGPEKLWKAYPLEPTPSPGAQPVAASPSGPAEAEGTPVAASHADGGGAPVVVLVLLMAVAGGAAATILAIRRRGEPEPEPEPAAAGVLPAPRLVAAEEPVTERKVPPAAVGARASPPDPARAWTAEIEWRQSDEEGLFRVVGRPAGGRGEATIAESGRLDWPPESVERLGEAVEKLESSLLAAGWEPLSLGDRWYSRRFAWKARQPAERLPRTDRFARGQAWPEEALDQWRCEIRWDAGYINSSFKATAFAPGEKRGTTIGESATFKWMVMDPPNPQERAIVAEMRRLAAALVEAGWQPVGRGSAWFSGRYVWDREEPPPQHVELAERSRGS